MSSSYHNMATPERREERLNDRSTQRSGSMMSAKSPGSTCKGASAESEDNLAQSLLGGSEDVGPELTVRGIVIAALLSILLGSASIYMGLFAGQSTSASLPSAVLSMAILRRLKNSNGALPTVASAPFHAIETLTCSLHCFRHSSAEQSSRTTWSRQARAQGRP